MTVCVAAICAGGDAVIGVADRMLTAADITFEPQRTKIWALTTSIIVMIAGDSALQMEILIAVSSEVNARIHASPKDWWLLRDVADLYVKHYNRIRSVRAEAQILLPLGLDMASWISRQRELAPSMAEQIAQRLTTFELPATEALIVGSDPGGVHIYAVRRGAVTCESGVDFAAIGIGGWHASSQLMFAGHTRKNTLAGTLYLIYTAKRRAEVAPGVGAATDMFTVGKPLGSYLSVAQPVLEELDRRYRRSEAQMNRAMKKAETLFESYLVGLVKAQPDDQQQPSAPGDAKADAKDASAAS